MSPRRQVPTQFSAVDSFVTFLEKDELEPIPVDRLTSTFGLFVGANKLAHVQMFPVANLWFLEPGAGSGVVILISTTKEQKLTHAKIFLKSLTEKLMLDLGLPPALVADRLCTMTVFRRDVMMEQFEDDDEDHPFALADVNPTFIGGPWPATFEIKAYVPERVLQKDFEHVMIRMCPPVTGVHDAAAVHAALIQSADKQWLPKLGSHQQQVDKIAAVIEQKTNTKLSKADRKLINGTVAKRGQKKCRTCKQAFQPTFDDQLDCDTRCRRAASCIDCGTRYRLLSTMSAYGDAHRWCICGGLAMTPLSLESYGLPISAPSPWLSTGWQVPPGTL
jgi:hypothetical protein